MSLFHKSLSQKNITEKKNLDNISTDSKPSTKPSTTSLFSGGSGFFSKSSDIDTKNEPLGLYYESRKKIILGKINILEDESFISQFLLKSQKKINEEFIKMTSGSAFFFDVPQKVYTFCLGLKENLANFYLIIHLYLKLNREDKALEIFLLMCKENKKKLEFMYNKLNTYCKKSAASMKKVTPAIAKMLVNLLSCAIKFSGKFCKTNLQNLFFIIYLKAIYALNYREIKAGNSIYINEIKYNRLFLYASLLFDSSIFHFYNYYPLDISTKLLQHCLELYSYTFREKNNNELILMMKSNFNCGHFYFVDSKYKESTNCLHSAKELVSDIIQCNLNSKDDEKEFLNDLSGYSYLSEEKNSLFCLKIYNKRISKLHDKTLNLNKYIKENLNKENKKASSVVLGSKKYELQLPLLLDQIKRKINLEIDLLLCQIEMNKKNFRAAYDQISLILKSNTIKDDFEAKNNQRKKRLGINKNFKSLKTYQNIRVKPKIAENNETRMDLSEKEFNLIFSLLEKIEYELSKENLEENSFNFIYKKRNTIFQNIKQPLMDYTNFKEMEKFFIFICNLSLFQLKILNESQPEYSPKRDDLPIIFTTPFRDCLTNSQRMDLDQLETMSLTRYIILVDSKKEISPENLDYKYMKYKVKTPASNEEEAEMLLSFDDDENNSFHNEINKNNNYENKKVIKLKKGRNSHRKFNLENKGLFSLSTNNNNCSTMRKTITTATLRKRTSAKKSLTFNDDSDDVSSLDLMFRNLRDEKNAKFMNKNRKFIMEYLYGLDKDEKKFLLNNPTSLQKMLDKLSNKISKKNERKIRMSNKNKKNVIKINNDISISFSYEISQQSQINSKKG